MQYMKIFWIFTLIAAIGLTYCSKSVEQAQKKEAYTCPMHPEVISDRPGVCPICNMNLVLKAEEEPAPSETMTEMISLSQNKQMLANVATIEVRTEPIVKKIAAYSYLDFAEPNRKLITARFNGRIEKLFVNKTGDYIKKNQPLFDVYSPDLVQAQNDFLVALSGGMESASVGTTLLTAARKKLELLGLTDEQISSLESGREVKLVLTYHAPLNGTVIEKKIQEGMYVSEGAVLYDVAELSVLWSIAEVFENDLAIIKVGQVARLRLPSFPGEEFEGKVGYIYPVVNAQTRTVTVRSEFGNAGFRLKPQMFGETIFESDFGSGITVPETAVLFTGKRNIVWLQTEEGKYEPREVQVGFKLDGKYQILSGLTEGEKVVVSGGYLIDSESQLTKRPTSL
ncbi:MAG: efflux RND transporter periplasmic adaptor subunit [candidate division KSB1 bacterium]|nr:efflux RND transporter periplasmic adaptor subunit [candidate division KSB1 bacterium]